jgi:hypothetical protein
VNRNAPSRPVRRQCSTTMIWLSAAAGFVDPETFRG